MDDTPPTAISIGTIGGGLLVLVGVGAYLLTGFASVTALIPALFGAMIALIGYTGRRPANRLRSITGMGLLALLVVLGSVMGLADLVELVTGGAVERPVAAIAQGASVVIGLVIVTVSARYAIGRR